MSHLVYVSVAEDRVVRFLNALGECPLTVFCKLEEFHTAIILYTRYRYLCDYIETKATGALFGLVREYGP